MDNKVICSFETLLGKIPIALVGVALAGIICLAIIAVISFSKYQESSNINKSYATNFKEAEKLISEDKFSEAKQYYNEAMNYKFLLRHLIMEMKH